MSAAKSICVLQPDFCGKAVGRLLACLALVAFLALHTSMVWHGPEHALNASSGVTEAATLLQATTAKVATADSAAAAQNIATIAVVSSEDLVSALSAAVVSPSEQASPASDPCLKCLEDVANTVGLTSQAVQIAASRTDVLQPRSQPVCLFATPVACANQRGPPTFLS